MRKIILISILFLFIFVAGCNTQTNEQKKADFFVKTEKIDEFNNLITISKPAKLLGEQNIVVTSQVRGRVENIINKEGDEISKGSIILNLADEIQSYGLMVQRAQNALDRAKLNYEQSKISIEKTIKDSKLILSQAENTYETVNRNNIQALKKAEQDLSSSSNQIDNLRQQFKLEKNNFLSVSQSIISFSDKLLGITDEYKHFNDDFEYLLGAKDTSSLNNSKQLLKKLYKNQDIIKGLIEDNLNNADILSNIDVMYYAYLDLDNFLITLDNVIDNSIEGINLNAAALSTYKSNISVFKNSLKQSSSAFVSYKNQFNNILDQDNLDITQETAEIYYEQTKLQLEKNMFDARIALDNAKTNYDTVVRNQENQLGLLKNAIRDAEISYTDAARTFDKLKIKAPINGTIGNIYVDKGQEISVGTPILDITNFNQQLLEIYISANEYNYIKEDMHVFVEYDGDIFSGNITSVSPIANNKTTLYKAIITLKDNNINLIGNVGNVKIPLTIQGLYLPINIVNIIEDNKGFIYIYTGNNSVEKIPVDLGDIWNDKINIITPLSGSLEIITSDINNYDEDKFLLQKR